MEGVDLAITPTSRRPLPPSAILTFPLRLSIKIAIAVLAQWLIVLPYLTLRANADDAGYPRIQGVLLPMERALGFGETPTERLQGLYAGFGPIEYVLFGAYASFFFLAIVGFAWVAAVDWKSLPALFLAFGLLYYGASLMFMVFPTEPPWMAIGVPRLLFDSGFDPGPEIDPNQLAAFPSLHAATPALFAFFAHQRGHRIWTLFAVQALLIALTVVYFGEHYVLDIVAGVALAFVCVRLSTMVDVDMWAETVRSKVKKSVDTLLERS
jgi:membrane-associated phospholipid phosphatase